MKKYYELIILISVVWFSVVLVFGLITEGKPETDPERILKLNDIVYDVEKNWGDASGLEKVDNGVGFVVTDLLGERVYATDAGDEAQDKYTVETAIKNGYPYRPVIIDGKVTGYVIMKDDGSDGMRSFGLIMVIAMCVIGAIFIIAALIYGSYVRKNISTPFRNMKSFAGRIAEGNLDAPLEMDRSNMFGAFTEGFDIMREELRASKEREVALQKREKELVASLSHDLKTPVTGIKLTCEVLKAKLAMGADGDPGATASVNDIATSDLEDKIDTIHTKADQIDALVTDLLSSTMEDLKELRVSCADESSELLSDIVRKHDDRELVSQGEVPEVVISVDARRMSQVIGNIITNSYKYADTPISVNYRLAEDHLEMRIEDEGPGVPPDELELITNKFYRGKQWAESKEGSGLGLYISKLLMEKMDGDLIPENTEKGFSIILLIPLS